MSNQEKRQQSVRSVTGTAYAYNDDWMALFTAAGITTGVYNERLLVWINTQLGTAYTTLPDAMKAFAVSQGVTSWDEMGTFTTGLSLNFLSGSLDPRITFSRASQATMYDSTGKLTYAPNNLSLNSQNFSGANWTTANFSRTTGQADPFGGTNATLGTFTSNGGSGLQQSALALSSDRSHIVSIYARFGTWRWFEFTTVSGSATRSWVDMQNGVAGATVAHSNFTVTSVGSGWFRISAKVQGSTEFYWTPRDADGNASAATANNGATFFVYGFQAEAVTYETAPRAYVATTGSAYYGPRFDYNPATLAARGLLIEEARTNLLLQSEAFSSSPWVNYGTNTVTSNATTAPDGTNSADLLSANVDNGRSQLITGISASTAYTISVYAKLGAVGDRIRIVTPCFAGGSYLGDLVVPSSPLITSGENVGNGWYRHALTGTTPATTDRIEPRIVANTTGDEFYIWGAQLEAGSFATSYIPTAAASVTRAADSASMTGTNFSSWYNQSEGTFVANFTPRISSGTPRILGYDVAAASTPMFIASSTSVQVFDGSNPRASASGLVIGSANKAAMAYTDGVSHSIVANGGTVGTSATDYNTGTPTNLLIGYIGSSNYLNGWITAINYYNTRLPNATLQSLTT